MMGNLRIKGEVGFISHYRYAAKKLGEQHHVWEAFGERQPPWSASSDLTRVGKTAACPPCGIRVQRRLELDEAWVGPQ